MNLKTRYKELLDHLNLFSLQVECLQQDRVMLEQLACQCIALCCSVGSDLLAATDSVRALPTDVATIYQAFEVVEKERELNTQLEKLRRELVVELVESLRRVSYAHKVSRLQKAGEETRLVAIQCLDSAIDDSQLCRVICGNFNTKVSLFEEWKKLSEDAHSQETSLWPADLTPIAELRVLFENLVPVDDTQSIALMLSVSPVSDKPEVEEIHHGSLPIDHSFEMNGQTRTSSDVTSSRKNRDHEHITELSSTDSVTKNRRLLKDKLLASLPPSEHDPRPPINLRKNLTKLGAFEAEEDNPIILIPAQIEESSHAGSNSIKENEPAAGESAQHQSEQVVPGSLDHLIAPPCGGIVSDSNQANCASKLNKSADECSVVCIDKDLPKLLPDQPANAIELVNTNRCSSDLEPEQVFVAAWEALDQERFSLAFCILKAAQNYFADLKHSLPPSFASVVLLSSLTTSTSSSINEQLRRDFADLNENVEAIPETYRLPVQLLTMSCALQPALVAPFTDAGISLMSNQLPVSRLRSFIELCRAVGTFSQQHIQVDPSVLTGVCAHAVWQNQMSSLKSQLRDWWQSERSSKVIFAHTTNVWQNWLEEGGVIGAFLSEITQEEFGSPTYIEEFISEWEEDRQIDRRCKTTDQELRGNGARRRPIDGRAFQAIRQKVSILRDLLNALRQKLSVKPDSQANTAYELVKQCRDKVLQELEPAIRELKNIETNEKESSTLRKTAKLAGQNLDNLRRLFTEPQLRYPPTEQVSDLLNADLVLAPGADLAKTLSMNEIKLDSQELEKLVQAALNPLSEQQAFELQTRQKNHAATERLIQKLQRLNQDPLVIGDLIARRHEALDQDRIGTKHDLDQTLQEIEKSVCFDLVNEADRLRLTAEIESIRTIVDEETNFNATDMTIKRIQTELTSLRDARLRDVRARFESLNRNIVRQDDLDAIQKTLDSGDFPTADEYISLVRDGETLDLKQLDEVDEFHEFFNRFLPATTKYLKEHPSEQPAEWIRQLDQKKDIVFGKSFNDDNQVRHAKKMLEEWRLIHRIRAQDNKRTHNATCLFSSLGFDVKSLSYLTHGGKWLLEKLETTPISNTNICAVPDFGSKANGRYQVLSIDNQCSDSDIEKIIADTTLKYSVSDGPLIVVFLGRLDEHRRRKISRETWGKNQFLFIDEYLVMYLATKPDGTLKSLFQCTLPFTFTQPYSTTASYVPNEMFVGRNHEFRAILSQDGTNLVFGGRQLGKSVLLREVERRSHSPSKGVIVRWVDLKNRGIGTHEPASELWPVIADVLLNSGVLKQAMRNPQTIQSNVKSWLAEAENRRILLLLDEADEFFNQDSQQTENSRAGFPVVSQLKGLMDETNRRFKVVFAGLHNVQRAAKDSNTPIAHLGRPINIGPLLDNGEWKNARELIELPLRQMGYEFESANIVTRILSHTNFYPSLIQIFCRHLLISFQKRSNSVVDFKNGPRHKIALEDIDRIYQSSELQDEIRSRFELTLNLDERYRLIALLIALQTIQMREVGIQPRGLTLQEIRSEALSFWSEGFKHNSTFDGFEILLDEMVGLGVLRRDPDGSYTLRSANVLNLMGSKKRIEERLFDVASSPPPAEYSASSFRRSFQNDSVHRSPLTTQQEGKLLSRCNGVSILVGSRLALTEEVQRSLSSLQKSDVNIETFEGLLASKPDFLSWLEGSYQGHSGLTLVLVPFESHWNAEDVKLVSRFLNKKQAATKNFLRVVFIADPPHLWNIELQEEIAERVEIVQLQPWKATMLDRWLDDNNFNRDTNSVRILTDITGNWGKLIQDLVRRCSDRKHAWNVELNKFSNRWISEAIEYDYLQLPSDAEKFLRKWAQFGNDSGVDQDFLVEMSGESNTEKLLAWGEHLSYIERTHEGHFKINPFVYKVLLGLP